MAFIPTKGERYFTWDIVAVEGLVDLHMILVPAVYWGTVEDCLRCESGFVYATAEEARAKEDEAYAILKKYRPKLAYNKDIEVLV